MLTPKDEQNVQKAAYTVLWALCFCHLFNDTFQSLISAVYPMIKDSLSLTFTQIGIITLTFQFSSSVFQPFVGGFTDKFPLPYSLPLGMLSTMTGLFCLSQSWHFGMVLVSVALIGFGSSIFHPEASRLAYLASGGRFGLAQSLFQVGGNFGSSLGPLLAAFFIVPHGQGSMAWFVLIGAVALSIMLPISRWYHRNLDRLLPHRSQTKTTPLKSPLPPHTVWFSLSILLILIFSKYAYLASLTSYYTFYLMAKFQISIQQSQLFLFVFLFSIAAGTFIGGPIGDRIGRKYVIWGSVLGVIPFTLVMPYADSLWLTCFLSIIIGLVLSSAFSAILIFAQELLPGKVGTIAGLFFGFAFGVAGMASAAWGRVADHTGIEFVYHTSAFLPLFGLAALFLPNLRKQGH